RSDRLLGSRRLSRLHRHPQPLRREGARRSPPAHEGAAGHHPRGLRPGRHLGGPVRAEERAVWKQKLSGLLGDFGVEWDWSTVREYLSRVARAEPGPDVAYLVPHGAIRQCVLGGDDRRADAAGLSAMQDLLRESLAQGACGLSTGLIYPPCCYADTEELIALGRVLAEMSRPLVVHMRSESDRILEALDEMIRVARESGSPVHVSHLKVAGRENWPRA